MELISPTLRIDFREFCVALALRQIDDIFRHSGIARGQLSPNLLISGERRTRVEEYYATLNWTLLTDAEKFLQALGLALAQSYIGEEQRSALHALCTKEGLSVDGHMVTFSHKAVGAQFKNLIFAADGPKPEIILIDSISNDIRIVNNEQYCLVYDRPIASHGLLWQDLVDWWAQQEPVLGAPNYARSLYHRLERSLASEPERILFRAYYQDFHPVLHERLPALVPQVYLHYDPYTLRQLSGGKRLQRQRMDFLILFSNHNRVVIEVDGKQHYAEDDRASPQRYAEMVAEDRRLRLAGYEVYRFGAYELLGPNGSLAVNTFFQQLLEGHSIM